MSVTSHTGQNSGEAVLQWSGHTVKNKAEAPDEYPDLSGNQSKYIWISVHPSLLDKFPV